MRIDPEERKKARRKAMLLLEHMDRTEKGLSDRLRQAGFSKEAREDAIDYVKSYGYIDDFRYACTYITGRVDVKSRQKILMELQQKGVEKEVAWKAWEEVEELLEPDEYAVLKKSILKKYPEDTQLDEKEMRRLYGYLARRGFAYGEISEALEELHIVQNESKI